MKPVEHRDRKVWRVPLIRSELAPALLLRLLFFVLPALALITSVGLPTGGVRGAGLSAKAPKPGAWTQLGASQGGITATLVHESNGKDLVVWMPPVANSLYWYDAAELKPTGGMASGAKDIFGGHHWTGLDPFSPPTLLIQNGKPLLVFGGGRSDLKSDLYSSGCIVGDLLTPGGWQLQSWSLSADCRAGHFGATITSNGTLSAAWPGGWANGGIGILYRIGTSSTIPASTDDQHISTAVGQAGNVAETTETGSQDIYAAWARFDSQPASKNGLWAADLSKNGAPAQAPGTGTNTVTNFPEPVAIASPTGQGGVYLAYCDNANPCGKVELWRVGSGNAMVVPKSSGARAVSLSAGPAGRLWISWWSASNGTVSVVRTNEAANRFGPVKTYAGPSGCKGDANATIKISGGSQQRLDVIMSCFNYSGKPAANHVSATQSLVPLQISASTAAINHKHGGSVTYRVSDVGDAVAGATVKVAGRKAKTNGKGQVTFRFPKGARTGSFKAVATMPNYLNAATSLQIT